MGSALTLAAVPPACFVCRACETTSSSVPWSFVDKAGGAPFSFDDVEVVTLLAGIAGVALGVAGMEVPSRPPAEFGAELAHIASSDPAAYARLSVVLEALLGRG